ncbi:MAG TPA: flagellar filament capping protein FliD [Polyangiaceae bacterium]
MDTESIVTGLVNASKEPLSAMKSRQSQLSTASSTLSKIGSLMAKLKTALEGVDETREIGSFKASSSSNAIVASATGNAAPGNFSISVGRLAAEQRTYSTGQSSSTTALGASGTLGISVAGATATNLTIAASDTLEGVAAKINAAGLRVSASVFHDGSQYRLQVRGLDSGAANTIAFSGSATLGLDVGANTRPPVDAQITIDNFTVTRPTNQVVGVIPGVTLNLTDTTPSGAVTVKIENDPEGLKKKLTSVIDAYNAVVDSVHTAAGFGSIKASEKELAGDSLLRSMSNRMSSALSTAVTGSGQYTTLASLGVSLGRDGKLSMDGTKLDAALTANPSAVASVIAGTDSGGNGAADLLRNVVTAFTATGTGLLASRQSTLDARAKSMTSRIDREQDRLDRYADALRKAFTVMDGTVAANNAQRSYLF